MIIKDLSGVRRRKARVLWSTVLAALAVGFMAFLLWPAGKSYQSPPVGGAFCSAEKVKGGRLYEGKIDFGGAELRSDAHARSGSYSCRLPAAGKAQYGFSYSQERPEPGVAYKASVWRKKELYNSGILAVKLAGEAEQYFQENTPCESDDRGWEKLEIRFYIPYGKKTSSFSVYVYSEGHTEVFFDDLLVEPLPGGEEAFRPEVLQIYLKKESLQALKSKREEALRTGILESDDSGWVEASLEGEGSGLMTAEIRLKGDWLDHLQGQKWSFRVKLSDGNSWRQLRVFSLHTPATRYFLHEWLLHQLWEREDVLTTRYDFVELRLNGESLGLYAYEEHFEKQLPESRRRREGPIMKFSEDGYWQAIKRQLALHGYLHPHAAHAPMQWENASVEAFQETRWLEDPAMARQYEQARLLMEQYRQGSASPGEIFDLERLARYYALCDITRGYHGIAWHNQRFYYNPITGRLEPIGFDGYGGPPEPRYAILGEGALNPASLLAENIFSALFMDREFAATYIRELKRLSSRDYLAPALDSLYPGWAARLAYLQMEFPAYAPQMEEWLAEGSYVQSLILPYEGSQSLLAYTQMEVAGQLRLQIRNRHNLPLEIVGYGVGRKKMDQALPEPPVLPAPLNRKFLSRMQRDSSIRDFNRVRFLDQGVLQDQAAPQYHQLSIPGNARFLFFRALGADSLFVAPILPYAAPEGRTDVQKMLAKAAIRERGPYRLEGKRIIFPEGKNQVYEDIILPAGYDVVFEAGAELGLHRKARFVSFSPVQAFGEAEKPVKIFSDDASGSFTVMQAGAWSNLSNVWFEGLNTIRSGGWELSGAVNFYEADVRFYRCAFRNNHCEDALNVIHSEFELRSCLFSDTPFDAFDADFSKGIVENCRFLRTGKDGMEFSGSIANIKNCLMENNGDKALNVGEESDAVISDSTIKGAQIALASRDYSTLFVRGVKLKDCQQGFVAFQNKAEFGPAKIIVESFEAENVRRLYYTASGSVLQLEEKIVQ